MLLIVDFSDRTRGGDPDEKNWLVIPHRRLIQGGIALVVLLLVASYFIAHAIVRHMVSSDSNLLGALVRQEVVAEGETRRRLWQESIGTLKGEIAATNVRVLELYRRGALLSDKLGLSGDEMFDTESVDNSDFLCSVDFIENANSGGGIGGIGGGIGGGGDIHMRLEEKQIAVANVLLQQNKLLNDLQLKYAALRRQHIVNTVSESTVPLDRPVAGRHWVSSRYGYRRDPFSGRRAFHAGDDYAARRGTPIVAAASGIVIHAGRLGNYGNTVHIYHGDDISTLYAHMDKVYTSNWTYVGQGEVIGTVGSTGRSTGYHLHYEVRVKNRPQSVLKTIRELRAQRNLSEDGNANSAS